MNIVIGIFQIKLPNNGQTFYHGVGKIGGVGVPFKKMDEVQTTMKKLISANR